MRSNSFCLGHEGCLPETCRRTGQGAAPAGEACNLAPGRLRGSALPAIRPVREELAGRRRRTFGFEGVRKRGPEPENRRQWSAGRRCAPIARRTPRFTRAELQVRRPALHPPRFRVGGTAVKPASCGGRGWLSEIWGAPRSSFRGAPFARARNPRTRSFVIFQKR